jgi:hypothetical protein
MNETIPVWSRRTNASVLALVVVLALLVAPVCAPLCAASACSSGGERQRQCHDMAGMGSYGGEQLVAAGTACGAADFSAVLVKTDEQPLLSQEVEGNTASALIGGSPGHRLASLDESPGLWSLHQVPLKSVDSLLATTILRI